MTPEEFERLIENCTPHLQPVVLMAYHTGMRRSEILFPTWSEADLVQGFMRLTGDRTKTGPQGASLSIHALSSPSGRFLGNRGRIGSSCIAEFPFMT